MAAGSSASRVKWLSDQEKSVLISNFEKRGWVKGSSEGKPMRGLPLVMSHDGTPMVSSIVSDNYMYTIDCRVEGTLLLLYYL